MNLDPQIADIIEALDAGFPRVETMTGAQARALIRSRLWQNDYKMDRSELPPYGRMLKDQIETVETAEEIQASIENGYANKLY